MQGFKRNIEVDIHDVDFNGVCRVSSLMKYIQSAAELQLAENGMSYNALKDMGRAFVVSRIRLEFTKPVYPYERLQALTFPCESRGFSFLRCYSLSRDGEIIGRAISVWALVDTESRALVKVNDFDLRLPTYNPLDITIDRFRMPSTIRHAGKYTICYADLDQNRHINNTRYPDIFANFLPMEGKRIDSITINYLCDARLDDVLDVYADSVDGTYYLKTVRPDGKVNAEAEIHLSPI